MDVFASQVIFEKTSELAPIACINFDTPARTRVALLAQEGGGPIAFGIVSDPQLSVFGSIRVKTATCNQLLITVNTIIVPSAVGIFHWPPRGVSGKTKANALTLCQLQEAAGIEMDTNRSAQRSIRINFIFVVTYRNGYK